MALPLSFYEAQPAAALSGTGYFTGRTGSWFSGYGGDVLSGRPGRNALQPSNYASKNAFINFIRNQLGGGGKDRVGAAFIVNLMLDADAPGGWAKDRSPSAAMVNDWEARLRDSSVTMSVVNGDPNAYGRISFYDPGINDDFFTSYNSGSRALLRFHQGGRVVAVVEIPCGNPVGGLAGLDPLPFRNDPESTVTATATPGQTVTFRHRVTNIGAGNMERRLNAYAEWNGGVKAGDGVRRNCDVAGGLNAGQTDNGCNNDYTIPAGATVGSDYCQRLVVSPHSTNDSGSIASTRACVRVVGAWDVTPTSTRNSSAVGSAGAAYSITHRIRNNGPNNVNQAGRGFIEVRVEERLRTFAGDTTGWSTLSNEANINSLANGAIVTYAKSGNLPAAFDADDQYCQRIVATYGTSNNAVRTSNPPACIAGSVNYELTPEVTVNPSIGIEAGANVTATPSVNNAGSIATSGTQWELVQFIVPSGSAVPGESTGAGGACGYYGFGCVSRGAGTGSFGPGNPSAFTFASGAAYGPISYAIPDDATVGTKYCFALAVQPFEESSADWRYGEPACVRVGIKPKIQVLGYDLVTGGEANTSVTSRAAGQYGSWTEYGLRVTLDVNGMGSGNSLANGASGALANWSTLTFANTPTLGNFGAFVPFPTVNTSTAATFGDGTTFPNGTCGNTGRHICVVTGMAVINGNISYANDYATISNIPEVIIIADDIVIAPTVTRIDAWLIAKDSDPTDATDKGRISTCSTVPSFTPMTTAALTVDRYGCDNPLRFNGPVAARTIYLYRTMAASGPTDNPATPAEVFNLRAINFLSAFGNPTGGNPRANTDRITQLPPRF